MLYFTDTQTEAQREEAAASEDTISKHETGWSVLVTAAQPHCLRRFGFFNSFHVEASQSNVSGRPSLCSPTCLHPLLIQQNPWAPSLFILPTWGVPRGKKKL